MINKLHDSDPMQKNLLDFSMQNFLSTQLELQELIELNQKMQYRDFFRAAPGFISDDRAAIVGKDQFLFIKDGSGNWEDNLRGTHPKIFEASDRYHNLLAKRRSQLEERGIKYFHLIVPEKDSIYPELSPNLDYGQTAHSGVAVQISSNCIYPREILNDYKKFGYVYLKRNSHTNYYGGFFIASYCLSKMGFDSLNLSAFKVNFAKSQDDLAEKFVPGIETFRPVLKQHCIETVISKPLKGKHLDKKVMLHNPLSSSDHKLLVFGDSYSISTDAGIVRFLSYMFREVLFVWNSNLDFQIIDKFNPTIVLSESAERFHINPPLI